MEPWAKEWLEEQRRKGAKCLEIKHRNEKHYVYYSTTHWDKERKKAVKTSKYLGRLDRELGFIESQKAEESPSREAPLPKVGSVTEYGNAALLHEAMKDISPLLKDAFPLYWEEIYALSMLRVADTIPLKRAEDYWQKLYNVESIEPDLTPINLARMLHAVGADRDGQGEIFKSLLDGRRQLVYDLSSRFSHFMSISEAEKACNRDEFTLPQINIALLCSADSGLPTMIISLSGDSKDIAALCDSISDLDPVDKLLILGVEFFSEDVSSFLDGRKIPYLIPVKRSSHYYDARIDLDGQFRYHDRLIKCGRMKVEDKHLYLFEDQVLLLKEQNTLYEDLDHGDIAEDELGEEMKKAGRILVLSNQEISGQEAYELCQRRKNVDKWFDSCKAALSADRLYLKDDDSAFGHLFIAFLSLYAHCKLELLLKKAGLVEEMTPVDLLHEFSRVYHVVIGGNGKITEVPEEVREIEARLGLAIFPAKASPR